MRLPLSIATLIIGIGAHPIKASALSLPRHHHTNRPTHAHHEHTVTHTRTPKTAILHKLVAAATTPPTPILSHVSAQTRLAYVCTALAIYHEARSETHHDQYMIGSLIYTRTEKRHLSPCGVIAEHGQFSWAKYSAATLIPRDYQSWKDAVAEAIVSRINHPKIEYTHTKNGFSKHRNFTNLTTTKNLVYYNIKENQKNKTRHT